MNEKTRQTDTEATAMHLHSLVVEEFAKLDAFTRPMLAHAINQRTPFDRLPPKGRQAFLNMAAKLLLCVGLFFGACVSDEPSESPSGICRELMLDTCTQITTCEGGTFGECLQAVDVIMACDSVKGFRRDPTPCRLDMARLDSCPFELPASCEKLFR